MNNNVEVLEKITCYFIVHSMVITILCIVLIVLVYYLVRELLKHNGSIYNQIEWKELSEKCKPVIGRRVLVETKYRHNVFILRLENVPTGARWFRDHQKVGKDEGHPLEQVAYWSDLPQTHNIGE